MDVYSDAKEILKDIPQTDLEWVCRNIAAFAGEQTKLNDPLFTKIIQMPKPGKNETENLEKLSHSIEEPYLQAQEKGIVDAELDKFRQARAVDCLKEVLNGNYERSIYEALAALDNDMPTLRQQVILLLYG